jgi:transcriptional regulator with XRE-family HTH domain
MRKKHIDPTAGQRLREVRQHRGISQAELARLVGLKVGTIQAYEHARNGMSMTRIEQLARALQCEPADLMMPPGAPLPRYRFHSRWITSAAADLEIATAHSRS